MIYRCTYLSKNKVLFKFLMYLQSGRLSTDGQDNIFFLKSDTFPIPTHETLM